METKNGRRMTYRVMCILAVGVGFVGIALQLLPGWELLAFMLSLAALGGLIGGRNGYKEAERQQLDWSYKAAFEWLLLALMAVYAFIAFSNWAPVANIVNLLDGRWPGLVIALMCALMGLAGFQKRGGEGRPSV